MKAIYEITNYHTSFRFSTVIVTSASGGGSSSSGGKNSIPSSPRNTYTASLSYSQMINSRLQIMVMADVVTQDGYLI